MQSKIVTVKLDTDGNWPFTLPEDFPVPDWWTEGQEVVLSIEDGCLILMPVFLGDSAY